MRNRPGRAGATTNRLGGGQTICAQHALEQLGGGGQTSCATRSPLRRRQLQRNRPCRSAWRRIGSSRAAGGRPKMRSRRSLAKRTAQGLGGRRIGLRQQRAQHLDAQRGSDPCPGPRTGTEPVVRAKSGRDHPAYGTAGASRARSPTAPGAGRERLSKPGRCHRRPA